MLTSNSVMGALVVILLALCCLQLVHGQDFKYCTYRDAATGKNYDLTPLAKAFTGKAASAGPDAQGYTYYHSPCQAVKGEAKCDQKDQGVCQVGSSGDYVIGAFSKGSVGPLTGSAEGFAVTFAVVDQRGSTVFFVCDRSAPGDGKLSIKTIPPSTQPPPYLWTFEWKTVHACPGGGGGGGGRSGSSSGGGLSGGWIFVICLASVGVVYFSGGLIVQKFVFKKEGREIFPNSSFWFALPGLDGHMFIFRSIRRLFGGGYQQI